MKRSTAVFVLALWICVPVPMRAADPPPATPQAAEAIRTAALRDLFVGAALSERQRKNRVKKFFEIRAWSRKALEKALAEGEDRARNAERRRARAGMVSAFLKAGLDARAADRLAEQADQLREDWEALRKADTPEAERLRADRAAQAAWVHRRGFTRTGTEAAAAAYLFSNERFDPVPADLVRYLAERGFDEKEARILVLVMDLGDEVRDRMEAAAREAREPKAPDAPHP